jgi:hypothetical protein
LLHKKDEEAAMQIRLTVRDIRRVNNEDGTQYGELVRFQALEGPDNTSWAKGIPSSALELYITNPGAFGAFTAQGEYVFDVEAAPAAAPAQTLADVPPIPAQAPAEAPLEAPAQGS